MKFSLPQTPFPLIVSVVMRDGKVMRDDLKDGGAKKTQEEVAKLVKEALA